MTAKLTEHFQTLIRRHGPISVARYFADALGHPEFGYYRTRDPFGTQGDFITAPEVSQVFGELIGLWCLQCWRQLGAPEEFNLIELGPGRGTLMADLLRAATSDPAFAAGIRLQLVETSPVLAHAQAERLSRYRPNWHTELSTVASAPSLLIANEFFDALPVQQFEFRDGRWFERLLDLDNDGNLRFCLAGAASDTEKISELVVPKNGDIFETAPDRAALAGAIAARLVQDGGYGLMIDYGHLRPGLGDSLQALSGHQYVPVLQNPGAVDLTAHVDFAALADAVEAAGGCSYPAISQARFLGQLGIALRAEQLMQNMAVDAQEDFQAGIDRLISPRHMGELFKVLAISHPGAPLPAGFEVQR